MATWTTPPTPTVGGKITAAVGQVLSDDLTYLYDYLGSGGTDFIATSQTTASTAFTNLATVGPTVTVTTRTLALVIISATLSNSAANDTRMGFTVSGATTAAASTANAIRWVGTNTNRCSFVKLIVLTAGSNTFQAKYAVSAGTGTFLDRELSVVPL